MDVAFHTGVAEPLAYACRLVRKAVRQGAPLVVAGGADELARLDPLLWTFEPLEFIPHARLRAGQRPEPALARTPVWLVDAGAEPPSTSVLVNLGPHLREDWSRFARVIEIVGADDASRRAGRQRWRAYEAAGLKPAVHAQGATG